MKEIDFNNLNIENSAVLIKHLKKQIVLYKILRIIFAILLVGGIIFCCKACTEKDSVKTTSSEAPSVNYDSATSDVGDYVTIKIKNMIEVFSIKKYGSEIIYGIATVYDGTTIWVCCIPKGGDSEASLNYDKFKEELEKGIVVRYGKIEWYSEDLNNVLNDPSLKDYIIMSDKVTGDPSSNELDDLVEKYLNKNDIYKYRDELIALGGYKMVKLSDDPYILSSSVRAPMIWDTLFFCSLPCILLFFVLFKVSQNLVKKRTNQIRLIQVRIEQQMMKNRKGVR